MNERDEPGDPGPAVSRHVLARPAPGVAVAGAIAAAATLLAGWVGVGLLGYESSPLSPILLAVLLGVLIRNTIGLHDAFVPGLALCMKPLLRIGVALLGIRLSLAAVASIGLMALPIVAACIAAALLLVTALTRLLRLPPRLGWLIGAGTSICGISAIVAIAPVIDADETETSYAVATVALFGMLALFTYPFVAHWLFPDAGEAGLFLGTSIHDTSQVVGAALAYQQQFQAPRALETAVVTKLLRNLSMIVVIPLIGILHRRPRGDRAGGASGERAVPLFVVGFLAMAILRTLGDLGDPAFGVLTEELWRSAVVVIQQLAGIALLLAMAAVGLGTQLRTLRVLGLRPLAVGLAAALSVGGISALLIRL